MHNITLNKRGYTLYLVLVTVAVAGTLFTISLNISGTAQLFTIRHMQKLQAKLLAQSGIARAEYFLNGGNGHDLTWETDLFEEDIESYGKIRLSCNRFGAFARVISNGKRLKKEHSIEGLIYRDVPNNLVPVLTLSGHVGGLVLDYRTSINGKVVIHHGEVTRGKRRDNIPGSEAWTIIRESPPLPFEIKPLEKTFKSLSSTFASSNSDPLALKGSYSINNNKDSILLREKIVINGDCSIEQVKLNRILIVSAGKVTLGRGTECTGSTIICKELVISDAITKDCLFYSQGKQQILSGKHRSQFFGTDSILVGKEAVFTMPNIWVCHRKLISDTTLSGGIIFPASGEIKGHVICFSDTTKTGKAPYAGPSVIMGNNSSFYGCIITNGDIDFNAVNFTGHIWARSLSTKKDDVIYGNWLFNCKLSPFNHDVPFPLLGRLPARVNVVES